MFQKALIFNFKNPEIRKLKQKLHIQKITNLITLPKTTIIHHSVYENPPHKISTTIIYSKISTPIQINIRPTNLQFKKTGK
jgi:hypothetical protein